MSYELKFFFIKLAALLALTPFIGYGLLCYFEYFEKIWKSNNRRKKWLLTCVLFFVIACLGGFLQ